MRGVCPTFFRALCWEATQGGTHSYATAGYHLAGHTSGLLELSDEEPETKLADLRQALTDSDESAIITWYKRELPRCMALVPARRRAGFAAGVQACWEDDKMDI